MILPTKFHLPIFFVSAYGGHWSIGVPNLKFLAPAVPEIWRGPKIAKVGHVTSSRPLDVF